MFFALRIPLAVKAVEMFSGHILLIVNRQQALDVLLFCQPEVESAVLDLLLQPLEIALVTAGFLVQTADKGELAGRGGGGLNLVQMLHVLPEQLPEGGIGFLFQPLLIIALVAQKGLPRVQGQQLHRLHAPEQVGQSQHPVPNAFGGQHREIVRADQKKGQLTLGGFHAVFGELADAHELAGGLALPQLFLLFLVQIDVSFH